MIYQRKNRDKARLLHRGQEHADFPAREYGGEARGPLDLDLRPAPPVRPSEMIAKKQPQPAHRPINRAPPVAVILLEIVQERQNLLLPQQRSPRHPALPGQSPEPADILLLGALAQRFELDEADEGG